MSLRHHEIAETDHRILNPLLAGDLVTLAEAADLRPGMSVLDLCSGKGEMLCQWARSCGVTGVGVDLSQVFVTAARSRALEMGVAGAVSFLEAEAAEQSRVLARERPASFDVVACIGATWIGGGLAGTGGVDASPGPPGGHPPGRENPSTRSRRPKRPLQPGASQPIPTPPLWAPWTGWRGWIWIWSNSWPPMPAAGNATRRVAGRQSPAGWRPTPRIPSARPWAASWPTTDGPTWNGAGATWAGPSSSPARGGEPVAVQARQRWTSRRSECGGEVIHID